MSETESANGVGQYKQFEKKQRFLGLIDDMESFLFLKVDWEADFICLANDYERISQREGPIPKYLSISGITSAHGGTSVANVFFFLTKICSVKIPRWFYEKWGDELAKKEVTEDEISSSPASGKFTPSDVFGYIH